MVSGGSRAADGGRVVARLGWLWRQARAERPGVAAFALLVAAGAGCALAVPWVQKDLLDAVVASGVGPRIWWLLGLWGACALGDQACGAGRRLLATRLDVRLGLRSRSEAFRSLLGRPHAAAVARGSSQILSDLDYAARAADAVPLLLEWTVGLGARLAGAVGALLLLSRSVVLASAPFLVAYAVVPRLLAAWIRDAERAEQDVRTGVRGTVLDHAEGLRDIRLLGAEGWAVARVEEAWRWLGGAAWRTSVAHQGRDTVNWCLRTGAYLAAWAAGLHAVQAHRMGAGGLLAVTLYLGALFDPLDRVLSLQYHWIGWMLDVDRTLALQRRQAPQPEAGCAPADASIRVQGLVVAHPGQERPAVCVPEALDIPAGAAVALAGPNGAGKSTLLQCILGLLPADRGRVLLGGAEIGDIDERTLRAHVCGLLPDPAIFGGSVADNLRLARPDAPDDQLRQVLRTVGLEPWLEGLPQGLATPLARGDAALSAGQRQRLGLARLLLRDASVWVLDEPTSAIDPASRGPLWSALRRDAAGRPRTLVVATHAPEILAAADRVVPVQGGVVGE